LREGGSLPAIVEADDEGLYVLKFRGAGQGTRALIAELLGGELGRLAGLPVPELVLIDLPQDLARTEPDAEIQSLIRQSAGINVALDYLPGSVTYDGLLLKVDAELASAIVWFDAYLCNVDRTVRNTNMLIWHRKLWLIDHGAALYFHHAWTQRDHPATMPFRQVKDHVLLKAATRLEETDLKMRSLLSVPAMADVVAAIPEDWLPEDPGFEDRAAQRAAYLEFLSTRLLGSDVFVKEALRAHAAHV
jgi:hypothetical protein